MGTADAPIFDKFYTFPDTLRMQDLRLNFPKCSLEGYVSFSVMYCKISNKLKNTVLYDFNISTDYYLFLHVFPRYTHHPYGMSIKRCDSLYSPKASLTTRFPRLVENKFCKHFQIHSECRI
jgi:hypothetical protein